MDWLRQHKNQVRSFLIGAFAIGVTLFAASGVYLYRQRVATEAEIEMRRQESEAASIAASEAAEAQAEEELLANFRLDSNTVEWQGKTYKRNSYTKAILCMGIDRSNEMTETKTLGEAGQADGLFLIAQDTARNELKILMIPRDTMTEIMITDADGKELGKELSHLTAAFAYGDGMHGSCEYMSEAVSELLSGFEIDYYLAADTAVISKLNDAVGGVTVTIPLFGMENADPAFVPGEQVTLMGAQAEKFVRYRDIHVDHSAIFRMNQQKEYITQYFVALKAKSREDSQIVTKLFDMMEDYMVTDMAKDQYMKIALDVVASDGIESDDFRMIPGNSVTTEIYDEFYADKEGIITTILDLFYREQA